MRGNPPCRGKSWPVLSPEIALLQDPAADLDELVGGRVARCKAENGKKRQRRDQPEQRPAAEDGSFLRGGHEPVPERRRMRVTISFARNFRTDRCAWLIPCPKKV